MRLIDADELKHRMETVEMFGLKGLMKVARGMVIVSPTVDDVEVVRCKYCKWYESDGYHTNCQIMRFCVEAEDYCSMGERREDGEVE